MFPGVAVPRQAHLDQSLTNTFHSPYFVLTTSHQTQKVVLVATGPKAQALTTLKAFPGSPLRPPRESHSAGPELAFRTRSSSYHGRCP